MMLIASIHYYYRDGNSMDNFRKTVIKMLYSYIQKIILDTDWKIYLILFS